MIKLLMVAMLPYTNWFDDTAIFIKDSEGHVFVECIDGGFRPLQEVAHISKLQQYIQKVQQLINKKKRTIKKEGSK